MFLNRSSDFDCISGCFVMLLIVNVPLMWYLALKSNVDYQLLNVEYLLWHEEIKQLSDRKGGFYIISLSSVCHGRKKDMDLE